MESGSVRLVRDFVSQMLINSLDGNHPRSEGESQLVPTFRLPTSDSILLLFVKKPPNKRICIKRRQVKYTFTRTNEANRQAQVTVN